MKSVIALVRIISIILLIAVVVVSIVIWKQNSDSNTTLTILTAIVGVISLAASIFTISIEQKNSFSEKRSLSPVEYASRLKLQFQNDNGKSTFVPLPVEEQIGTSFSEYIPGTQLRNEFSRQYGDVEDVLDSHTKFVLIGEPGSGKSRVLRQIGLSLINKFIINDKIYDDPRYLPFFINLAETDNPVEPKELIRHWWEKYRIDVASEPFIADGGLFLLLDGLNEMPDGIGKYSLSNRSFELRHFIIEYKGPVIVTCRVADYNESLDLRLPEIKIIKLHATQIRKFAVAQLGAQAPQFIDALRQRRERLALATNPYALSMMIALFSRRRYGYQHLKFPNSRKELYDTYIGASYEDNLKNKKGKSKVHKKLEQLRLAWSHLAYSMMINGFSNTVDKQWAEKHIETSFSSFIRFSENLNLADGLNLGLLVENREESKIKFYHQTLYEHFAIPLINLREGSIKERLALIQKLENLGEIALPSLVTITELYVEQANLNRLDQYNACRSAMLTIALEMGVAQAVHLVLTVILEAAIRLYVMLSDPNAQTSRQILAQSLKSNFDTALAKAMSDALVVTRAADLVLAFSNITRRYQDETDLLAAELASSLETPSVNPYSAKVLEKDQELAKYLADADAQTLKDAQIHIRNLTRPSDQNIREAEDLILALTEARAIIQGKPLDMDQREKFIFIANVINERGKLLLELPSLAKVLTGIE